MFKNILRCSFLFFIISITSGSIKSAAQSNTIIPDAVRQVYGETTKSFSKTQIDWLKNQLDRSKVQKLTRTTGETIPLLSSAGLISKFVPTIQKDDFSNPQSVNPLKYNIDFFSTQDQFFRIDGTDYVLFVARKIN